MLKNPVQRSRFKTTIHFDDYKPEELLQIFLTLCKKNDYTVSHELTEYLRVYFDRLYETRDQNFGNGRQVRNLFEEAVTKQSQRIYALAQTENREPTRDEMMLLTPADIQ